MFAIALTSGITLATGFIFLDSRERPRRNTDKYKQREQENTHLLQHETSHALPNSNSTWDREAQDTPTPGIFANEQEEFLPYGLEESYRDGSLQDAQPLTAALLKEHEKNYPPKPLEEKVKDWLAPSDEYSNNRPFHNTTSNESEENQTPNLLENLTAAAPENAPIGGVLHLLADDTFY